MEWIRSIDYSNSGKFVAKDDQWLHLTGVLSDYELIFVEQGSMYIRRNKKDFVIEEGEYILFSPKDFQSGYKKSKCTMHWVHFESDVALPEIMYSSTKIPYPDRISMMHKQMRNSVKYYGNTKQSDVMLAMILLELQLQLTTEQVHESPSVKETVDEMIHYIRWNMHRELRVKDIAMLFGYHEKYVSNLTKRIVGKSLKDIIIEERMKHAQSLLKDTYLSIEEIANQIGYKGSQAFIRQFKKYCNLTPTAYRQSVNKNRIEEGE